MIASRHNTYNTTYLCVGLQVVVEYIDRYRQVSGVEGVLSVPALGSKLPSLCHTGVEVAQREEYGLELLLPAALVQDVLQKGQRINDFFFNLTRATCAIRETHLVKVIQSCMQIGQHACRRFIGDLDGIFKNPLKEKCTSQKKCNEKE